MPSFRSYIDLLSVLGCVCVCVPSTVLGARIQQCTNQTEVPLPVDIFLVEKCPKQRKMFIASPLG